MALAQITHRLGELRKHPGYRQNPPVVLGRAAAWAVHCLFGIPAKAKFRRWDFRLHLPAKWRGGGSTSPYLFRELYEPELVLLERFLRPGMTFIDGGANTGVFSFTAARLVGETGRVLAFEPGVSCYAALQRSVKLNGFSHVTLRQQALSDRCGSARLYHHLQQENAFSLGADDGASFDEVAIVTLDEVAKQEQLAQLDFIKLDVEGAEELVLRGATSVIERWRPIVLFEVNSEAATRLNLAADGACRLLEAANYRLFNVDDGNRLMEMKELPQRVANILALPAEAADTLNPQP